MLRVAPPRCRDVCREFGFDVENCRSEYREAANVFGVVAILTLRCSQTDVDIFGEANFEVESFFAGSAFRKFEIVCEQLRIS
jgi:hypothetical protein